MLPSALMLALPSCTALPPVSMPHTVPSAAAETAVSPLHAVGTHPSNQAWSVPDFPTAHITPSPTAQMLTNGSPVAASSVQRATPALHVHAAPAASIAASLPAPATEIWTRLG